MADLVALHSLGLDGRSFDPLGRALGAGVRVISPDLRGHGARHADPASSVHLAGMACDVVDTISEPVHLLGHSLGGAVAALVAAGAPDRVLSLTLVATPPAGAPAFLDRAVAARRSGMSAQVEPTLERWSGPHAEGPEIDYARACLRAVPLDTWCAAWTSLAAFEGYGELGRDLPRTLCVSGDADRSTPPQALARIAASIAGSTHVTVPGAGHLLPLQQAGALAGLLTEHWTTTREAT